MAGRDALVEALEERGWEVLDTFGGLRDSPSVAVAVEGLKIDDERFDRAELTVWEYEPGPRSDTVEDVVEEIRVIYEEL